MISNNYGADADAKAVSGLALGTSCYGKPIPIVYGRTRIGGNVIWMPPEFWAKVAGQQAGKGGGSQGSQDAYYQGVAIAIAEGPISLQRVWRDKDIFANLAAVETGSPFSFFSGARTQAPWSYFASPILDDASADLVVPLSAPYEIPLASVAFGHVTNMHLLKAPDGTTPTISSLLANAPIVLKKEVTGTPPVQTFYQIGADDSPNPTFRVNAAYAGYTIRVQYKRVRAVGAYAIGYGGTSYIATPRLSLGSSNTLKNFTYEVQGFLGTATVNPADVIKDLLTNTEYGLGWPTSNVEVDLGAAGTIASGYKRYAEQAGLLIAPAFEDQKPLKEHLRDVLDASNAEIVDSGGVLKVIPLGDVAVGTYTPATSPLYDIDADSIIGEPGADLIQIERLPQEETFNCTPIEYLDSETGDASSAYNVSVVEDFAQADVDASGGEVRKDEARALHCITKRSVAQYIARARAQRSIYVRNRYTFRVGWKLSLLEPLDLISITEPGLGITARPCRIREVEEDEFGTITIIAEDWPFGVATGTVYDTQNGDGGGQNGQVDPLAVNAPMIVPAPIPATGSKTPELWIAASGSNKDWGGAQVWISWDGASFALAGEVGAASYGVLSQSLAVGSPLDTLNTIHADVRHSRGTLASAANAADRDALETLCWVDGELLSYLGASLASEGNYDLTGLRRGASGTVASSHASGAPFLRVDSNVLRLPIDKSRYGQTVHVKLVSFNIGKFYTKDPATAPIYTYTLPSAGAELVASLPVRLNMDRLNLDDWLVASDSDASLSLIDLPSATGVTSTGKALKTSSGGRAHLVHKTLIPYEQGRMLRVLVRYRYDGSLSAPPTLKYGVAAIKGDGATYAVQAFGTPGVLADAEYFGVIAPTDNNWHEVSIYFKGLDADGLAGTSTSPNLPEPLRVSSRYVRLAFDANAGEVAGSFEIDLLEATDVAPYYADIPGGQIVDFSIDESALGDDSIRARHIRAGEVQTNHVVAGAIDASRIRVGVSPNQQYGSDFAAGYPTVPLDLGGGYVGGWAIYRDGASLIPVSTVALNNVGWTLGGTTDEQNDQHLNTPYIRQVGHIGTASAFRCGFLSANMQIVAGRRYAASVYTGAHRCNVRVMIAWYNGSGTYMSETTPDAAATNARELAGGTNIAAWKRISCYFDAPTNASSAKVYVYKDDTISGASPDDSYIFLCRAMFEEIPVSVDANDGITKGPTSPSGWVPAASTVLDQFSVKADALQTTGYTEDGSGYPTAGARMQSRGTALKVAPGNLRLGSTLLDATWFAKTIGCHGIMQYSGGAGGSLSGGLSNASISKIGTNVYRITVSNVPSGKACGNPIVLCEVAANKALQQVAVGTNYVDVSPVDSTGVALGANASFSVTMLVLFEIVSGGGAWL